MAFSSDFVDFVDFWQILADFVGFGRFRRFWLISGVGGPDLAGEVRFLAISGVGAGSWLGGQKSSIFADSGTCRKSGILGGGKIPGFFFWGGTPPLEKVGFFANFGVEKSAENSEKCCIPGNRTPKKTKKRR